MSFKESYFYQVFWQRFRSNRVAVAGGVVVFCLFLASVLAPYITPYDPDSLDLYHVLMPPSAGHWFGTDELGRDVFTRVVFGAKISLKVGFVAVGIAVLVGTIIGLVSAYYGGWIDSIFMRFVDIMLCFPTFFLILAVIAMLEPSIWYIMIIIGLTGWMGVARLVRAEVLSIRERDYIMAAKALGASDFRIIRRHVLPNTLAPVIIVATFAVANCIVTEASLTFFGLGVEAIEGAAHELLARRQLVRFVRLDWPAAHARRDVPDAR